MHIKVTMISGREYKFEIYNHETPDKFMHSVFKAKCVRFGKMILNTNEIESIEIE